LEPWEKVLVDIAAFSETAHGKKTCVDCHGGTSASADKAIAHEGMNSTPSNDPQKYCAECHPAESEGYADALHNTQAGYWTQIETRSLPQDHPVLEEMFGNHCSTCHTTCGECHVNQPDNVGGGLFSGHVFEKTPPMTRSCTACHGSRVGNEFLGKNEGFPGDVHFREGRMNCVKCHSGAELHGTASEEVADHRYDGAETPACVDCHPTAAAGQDDNPMHQQHSDTLSCQVCHSITYTSCDGCHVAVSDTSGNPYFETEATYTTFFIGRNPIVSEDRPYNYVPVRHVPVAEDSYEYYGKNLLPNFNKAPTWVYATPHNIQRNTPQNASCTACHENAQYFLTADKVAENELAANQNVIVSAPPAAVDVMLSLTVNAPALSPGHKDMACENCCKTCHDTGIRYAPISPENHAGFAENSCANCHKLEE
jgi:thiosulfate/3-mercaptopyruvate sulfurtransferase